MWEEIIGLAVQSGIFAVLFCGLLVYQLKDSAKREQKYQQIIRSLATSLSALTLLKNQMDDAVEMLGRINDEIAGYGSRQNSVEEDDYA